MKFQCCEYLLNEIVFAQSAVIPCCCSPVHDYQSHFLSDFDGKEFYLEEYLKKREQYIQQFKSGNIPPSCIGCHKVQEKEWDETSRINRIIITNRTKCSCDCVYCSLVTTSNQTKQELNTRKVYDILPVLYDLYSKSMIKEGCTITVAGGECCEYPDGELEYILYLALLLDCKLEILSSGMFYSNTIKGALKSGKCVLKISVDSGTKTTFEKIKRVKTYKQTWKNIKKYIIDSSRNKSSFVSIKYIIIPGINDNLKEAKSFIEKCKKVGCKNIELAVEYIWFYKHKDFTPTISIKETVLCIKNSGIQISYESQSEDYLRAIL